MNIKEESRSSGPVVKTLICSRGVLPLAAEGSCLWPLGDGTCGSSDAFMPVIGKTWVTPGSWPAAWALGQPAGEICGHPFFVPLTFFNLEVRVRRIEREI